MTKHREHTESPSLPWRKVNSDFCPFHRRVGPGTESMAMARNQGLRHPSSPPSLRSRRSGLWAVLSTGQRKGPALLLAGFSPGHLATSVSETLPRPSSSSSLQVCFLLLFPQQAFLYLTGYYLCTLSP